MNSDLSTGESAIVRGAVQFVHSHLVDTLGQTLGDVGKFVEGWFTFSAEPTKTRLENLKTDLKNAEPYLDQFKKDVLPLLQDAAKAAQAGIAGAQDFSPNGLTQAIDQLVILLTKTDAAIKAVAKVAATGRKDKGEQPDPKVEADIAAIDAPIVKALGGPLGASTKLLAAGLDKFCELLGVSDASTKLVHQVKWDKKNQELSAQITQLHGSIGAVSFSETTLTAYLRIPIKVRAGLKLEGKVAAGLRGDPMMDAIIPGQSKTKDETPVAITLDTIDGVTFGSGTDKRLVLPLQIDMPGVELREFAISRPAKDNKDGSARIDFTGVIAGKIGKLLAIVAEGGGVTLKQPAGQPSQTVPKRPSGLGFRIATGPITGGGFLQYREPPDDDYGAVAELAFGPIDLTAMAVFKTNPEFSFVAVVGTQFVPKIELGFGFTLNGVGGLLAYNRTLSIEKLTGALKDGAVSQILFPKDPVASAPKILSQLATIFPVDKGTFVIGPMVDLGWGSQTGIVHAKIGIIISSHDPQVVVLGSAQIQVPPDAAGQKLPKVVDLNLDLMAVIATDEFYLRASLAKSTLAGMTVSGDFGMLTRWSGHKEFALSAGGFFPNYPAPDKLKDLRRLSIPIKPPVPKVKLDATGYFALTSNSVQVGGEVNLDAKIGPVHGEGHFGLDALFEWSPTLHFIFDVRASVKLSLGGHTVAGVGFKGHLEGTTPWKLSGSASIEVLLWSIDLDLGPYTWGDIAPPSASVSALDAAVTALKADAAWSARSSKSGTYRLRAQPTTALLVESHTVLRAMQTAVPFDTRIDRIGPFPSDQHQLAFGNPTIGGQAVVAGGHITAPFATGQFQNLKPDEQLSRPAFEDLPAGVDLAAVKGSTQGPTADRKWMWETSYPGTAEPKGKHDWNGGLIAATLVGLAPVNKARRQVNPYGKGPKPRPIDIIGGDLRQVARTDRMTAQSAAMPASAAARMVAEAGGAEAGLQTVRAGVFG